MNKFIFLLFITLIFSCAKTPVETPFDHNSSLQGKIYFESSTPDTTIANVTLYQQEQGIKIATTQSDNQGNFEFTDITASVYQLLITGTGFEDKYISGITVKANDTTRLDSIFLAKIKPIEHKKMIIDGVIDEGLQPVYQNTNQSNWSGSNDFENLYITRDDDSLYIAVSGGFDAGGNCVNIYIDTDGNKDTGINDFSQISGGDIGAHLNKNVNVAVDFGADIAFSQWALASEIGVVSLSNPGAVDENIINSNIVVNSSVIEFAISLKALYPTGELPLKISLVAIIGGGDSAHFANDTIPQQSENFDGTFKSVFSRNY